LFVEGTVVIKVLVKSRSVEWKETAIVSLFLNDDNPLEEGERIGITHCNQQFLSYKQGFS